VVQVWDTALIAPKRLDAVGLVATGMARCQAAALLVAAGASRRAQAPHALTTVG
jgi:ATP-dependent protease ClpP protease subunit